MAEPRQPGKLEALLALASTGLVAWSMMPPQERLWVKLAVLRNLQRAVDRLAKSEGQQGMADELSGRLDPWQRYGTAYQLARFRDWLGKKLEDMRL